MITLDEHIIINFITGKCSEEDLQAVSQWLKANPEQKKELFLMERMFQRMQADNMAQAQIEKALKRVRAKAEASAVTTKPVSRFFTFHRYAAAAIIVMLTGLAAFWFGTPFGSASSNMMMVQASDSVAKKVVLPDGSVVWLNKRSVLYYPQAFAQSERKVNLIGEAFFHVCKKNDQPFIVESSKMSVKVLGTKFNFNNDSINHCSEVSLMEGAVEVSSQQSGGRLVLSPGQKAHLDYHTGNITVKQIETQSYAAWRYPIITFNKATIGHIAQKLETIYGVNIKISDHLSNSNTYSGRVLQKESIEEVFDALKYTLPISYRKKGETTYLWD